MTAEKPAYTIRETRKDGIRITHAMASGIVGTHGIIVTELLPGEVEIDIDTLAPDDYMARYNEYDLLDPAIDVLPYDPTIVAGFITPSA